MSGTRISVTFLSFLVLAISSCAPAGRGPSAPSYGSPGAEPSDNTEAYPSAPERTPSGYWRGSPTYPSPAPSHESSASRNQPAGKTRAYRTYKPYSAPERDIARRDPLPEERPGLATTAGESRYSPVRRVSFVRAKTTPWGMVSVYYNNLAGIAAQVRHRVSLYRCPQCRWGFGVKYSPLSLGGSVHGRPVRLTPTRWLPVRQGVDVWLENAYGDMLPGLIVLGRSYVIGKTSERYILTVRNKTSRRMEVVASVDGLDVLDRRPASVSKRGYIVNGGTTLRIQGFRLDSSKVAAFRFGSVSRSLAAQTYGDRNVGVIGVAVFDERPRVYYNDVLIRATARPFPISPYPAGP